MPFWLYEREKCKRCRWFSNKVTFFEYFYYVSLSDDIRKKVIGKCFRPRKTWIDYLIVEKENRKPCEYFEPKQMNKNAYKEL